jgi:hypothetical protein
VQVQPLQSAPIFSFGVESAPMDDDDKQWSRAEKRERKPSSFLFCEVYINHVN